MAFEALFWFGLAQADPGAFSPDVPAPTAVAAPSPAPSPSVGALPEPIAKVAASVVGRPLPERIGAISEALLGRPYVSDPMGEGKPPDPDPIARYDAFDCLTYVEEVLALSFSADPVHAAEIRASLRYGERPVDYANRRHFMELQWIPGTIAQGWLRDTTASYGSTVVLEKTVDAATWKNWGPRQKFALKDSELPMGVMRLVVLPLAEAQRVADKFRPGSILLTVRSDRAGVPLWVTHVSLVVAKPDGSGLTTLRHATKIGNGGTRDHPVAWYLTHLETYTNWSVLGVAILEPVEQAPRSVAAPPVAAPLAPRSPNP